MNVKEFLKRNRCLMLLLVAAILLRALFAIILFHNFGDEGFYPHNSEDAGQYLQMAKNFIEYDVFSWNESPPFDNHFFRTPGYPIFISIFYRIIPAAWFVIIFQNIIALGIIFLIYGIAMFLFQKKFIALTASLIYAVEPTVIYWNNQLLSETLFTLAVLLGVYIFVKNINIKNNYILPASLATGALFSLAIYIKPIAQFLLLIFLSFGLIILKMGVKPFLRYLISVTLIIISFFVLSAPWMIRNKILFGTYDFSSTASGTGFRRQLEIMYINTGDNMEDFKKIEISQEKIATVKYIAKHPLIFAKINLLSSMIFLMGDGYFTTATVIYPPLEKQRVVMEWWGSGRELTGFLSGHHGAEAVLFFGGKIIILFLNLFALAGIIFWFFKFKKNRAVIFLLLLIIYYFILASNRTSYSRFRQPVNPYIYIFVAAGIYWLADYLKSKFHKTKKQEQVVTDFPHIA